MKKIIILMLLFFTACSNSKSEVITKKKLIELEDYQNLNIEEIESMDIITYREGGDNRETIMDKNTIEKVYNRLINIEIGEETKMACEDNTTIYILYSKDNKYSFEFECEWFVLNNRRYSIKKD